MTEIEFSTLAELCFIFLERDSIAWGISKATIASHFGIVFGKRAGKSHHYRDVIIFEKLRFLSTLKHKACIFKKLRFRDGLVWTVGQTVEIKLRF